MNLFGNRLVVEYAKDKTSPKLNESSKQIDKDEFFSNLDLNKSADLASAHLESPNTSVVQNITNALMNCPKFYSQVRSLMIQMNLARPFNEQDQLKTKSTEGLVAIEVGPNESNKQVDKSRKRKIKLSIEEAGKKLKTKDASRRSVQNDERIGEYFDTYVDLKNNRINCKLKLNANKHPTIGEAQTKDDANQQVNGFGKFRNAIENRQEDLTDHQPESDLPDTQSDFNEHMTSQTDHLFDRQLTLDELKSCSVFDNYSIGVPSCRLYIKNIDKKVTEERLRTIYVNLLNLRTEADLNAFNVNLFKKGKMNGQAFVSLPNERLAKEAIDKTNGLLIEKKPICICYARSIKPKD